MDPVSAVGLIASIVQLIATTSRVIKYVDEVKDAPKEKASLAAEAANLVPLLMTLKQRVETSSSTDPCFSSVQSLGVPGGPLTELQVLMEQLGGKLKSRKKKLSGHLLWPSDQKECVALLAKIERVKSLIGLAMQDDHLWVFRGIYSSILWILCQPFSLRPAFGGLVRLHVAASYQ